jgi:hypothetical protein
MAHFYDHTGKDIQWSDLLNIDLETLTAIEACMVTVYSDHIRPLANRQNALRNQLKKEIEDLLEKGKDDGQQPS